MKQIPTYESFINEEKQDINLDTDTNNIKIDQISNKPISLSLVDGDWEIKQLIDVSTEPPIDESIILNSQLSSDSIKRGEIIYITAIVNKPGGRFANNSVGVIKARVIDIFNSLQPLNNIMKSNQ